MSTAENPIESWDFPPRAAVDPRAAAAEWQWVTGHAMATGLAGAAGARRTVTMEGETVTVRFEIYHGRATPPDRENRNL